MRFVKLRGRRLSQSTVQAFVTKHEEDVKRWNPWEIPEKVTDREMKRPLSSDF